MLKTAYSGHVYTVQRKNDKKSSIKCTNMRYCLLANGPNNSNNHEKQVKWENMCVCVVFLTLKSIPTVDIKLPHRNVPSRNRTSKHVFPTPESPSSITCWILQHHCIGPMNATQYIFSLSLSLSIFISKSISVLRAIST